MGVAIFHGDKGGVGKSFAAAAYAEYLASLGHRFSVIETDTRNGDVARFTEEFAAKIYAIDLGEKDGWRELSNVLGEDENNDIVVNIAGNIGGKIASRCAYLRAALANTKRHGTFFWLLGRSPDSIDLFRDIEENWDPAQTVVVRNLFAVGGLDFKFSRWDASKTRKRFLEANGMEIKIPEMLDAVVDATFYALPPQRFSGEGMRFGDRQMLGDWCDEAFSAFGSIADKISVGKL